jgi:hypothetical protein
MSTKLKELYVFIGLKDNARKVIIASIYMFFKKIRFLHANISFKMEHVQKVVSVCTGT